MSPGTKKNCLRLAIAAIYLTGMGVLYSSDNEVVWWFWMWPLFIAVVFYNLILWFGRCPSCREEFVLDPGERGFLYTTFTCRYCGAQCERVNGGNGGGGGP